MKFRMDALHYALLAVVVLLVVYCGASFFREGLCSGARCKVTNAQERKARTYLSSMSSAVRNISNPLLTDHLTRFSGVFANLH